MVPDRQTKGQGHLLSCSGQLKTHIHTFHSVCAPFPNFVCCRDREYAEAERIVAAAESKRKAEVELEVLQVENISDERRRQELEQLRKEVAEAAGLTIGDLSDFDSRCFESKSIMFL